MRSVRLVVFVSGLLFVLPSPALAVPNLTAEVRGDAERVAAALRSSFVLTSEERRWVVPPSTVQKWVSVRADGDTTVLKLRPGAIYAYLNQRVSPVVNDLGENARFVFRDGTPERKAPGREGKRVDGVKTSLAIRSALLSGKSTVAVSFKPYRPPAITLDDFLALGIRERIGRGESNFAGSPRHRAHNIRIGRLRYQGVLVPPDEEFSFNRFLGPVTEEAGYLPELVIKENVTTPEYGGGLCQVSTTVFRAAVNTGVDVTARKGHAYPVTYYGKPGFDATIYPPRPDLRFRNTTGNWILLQTTIEGTKLIVNIYGTPDGRTVELDGPHISERRPDGSLRTLLRQTVKDQDGKVIHTEVFKSTYQSPEKFPIVRRENGEV